MNQTEDIKDLVAAISKVQGSMKPAKFNKKNSHFKSGYADYSSCMDACRELLSENGLSVLQYCETVDNQLSLATMIAHTSGQWLKAYLPLFPAKMDSQGIGSAITYAKRYGLSAMLGIVTGEEDDDGEAAVGRHDDKPPTPSKAVQMPNALKEELQALVKSFSADQKLEYNSAVEHYKFNLNEAPDDKIKFMLNGARTIKAGATNANAKIA